MRRVLRATDAISALLVLWTALALVPVHWIWFAPGGYLISDSSVDVPPKVEFQRTIKRDVKMTYSVVIRKVGTRDAVCDPVRGPFTYSPNAALPETVDLIWWTGGDDRCWPREPGSYLSETCWTVVKPFFGIVPPKTICIKGNGGAPFHITALAPDEAAQAVEKQRQLQDQVEELTRGLQVIRRSIGVSE